MAGISVATASRALSNPDLVAESTRNAVRDAAASCGYKINLVARSLRLQRTNTILVLVPVIDNYFYPEIIKAMEKTAREQGFSMILGMTSNEQDRQSNYFDLVVTQRVDGLITLDAGSNDLTPDLSSVTVPAVQVLESVVENGVPVVGVDNGEVASSAVQHLLELGHRRIAHIAGRPCSNVARERQDGYVDSLKKAGLSAEESLIVRGDYGHDTGVAAMKQLLSMKKPPTAVFCANDASALGALRACKLAGLRVPTDISIVGVDDVDEAKLSDPPLTTVRQPRHDIGCRAMELLIQAIKGRHTEGSVMLPTQLIVRDTTARVAAA